MAKADIVVKNGMIVALDRTNKFHAKQEEDAAGGYVIPGLIDGHIHIGVFYVDTRGI